MTFEIKKLVQPMRTLNQNEFTMVGTTDGTNTVVEVLVNVKSGTADCIGWGTAKRRKGDARNNEVGFALALGRAFQMAADNYAAKAKELLGDDDNAE